MRHFWKLLEYLGIPYATLLDLDLGRHGGGFGRVKTAIKKLIDVGISKEELLDLGEGGVLFDDDFAAMHKWQDEEYGNLMTWVDDLKAHGIYYSSPLDFDLAMLEAFPDAYEAIIPENGGPKMSPDDAAKAVFGAGGPGLTMYTGSFARYRDLMPAYRYHFLTNSKPATHLAALAHIKKEDIKAKIPKVLKEVLQHISEFLHKG